MNKKNTEIKINNTHELNINNYSLDELLDLFQLKYDMNITDLKQAKKKVLSIHPDKSGLPSEYFLFYKKAYEKIIELYEDIDRQNRPMTKEATKYNTEVYNTNGRDTVLGYDENVHLNIKKQSKKIEKFNKNFNDLFEKNMIEKPNTEKNKWFYKEENTEENPYNVPNGVSVGNIGKIMEEMKVKADSTNSLIRHKNFRENYHSSVETGNLYENENEYITTSSLFGRLKFDDIRKVHRDETIIPVGTSTQIIKETAKRAITMDEFISQRETKMENPLIKEEAEKFLEEKQRIEKIKIMEKQYKSNLKTEEFNKKNNIVLANMFRIKK